MGIEETLINTSEEKNRIRLLILCGPSGVGKSTIIAELCKHDPNLTRVNAITDRPPRKLDTKVCISPEEYDKLESNGEFAFSHSIYGYRYGNKKSDISMALGSKRTVIMDFPLEYVESFTSFFDVPTKVVFIRPPSLKELRHRLSEK
jgi:guanylate kinase